MPPIEPELNPVSVIALVLTVALGPQLAAVAGAYTVILIAWFGGAIVGALRMPRGRVRLALFVVVSLVVTLGITVPLSNLLAGNAWLIVPGASAAPQDLLFPIAFILPAVGHSWVDLGAWLLRHIARRINPPPDRQP